MCGKQNGENEMTTLQHLEKEYNDAMALAIREPTAINRRNAKYIMKEFAVAKWNEEDRCSNS